ncbi:hypothetical protein [Kitasatospora sp. NPDC088783]|uniref:hypothetical protein n=1 Tax=Kitasatospora sp. NPDC088783 TaxID=3364077 RepID=UPI003820C89D
MLVIGAVCPIPPAPGPLCGKMAGVDLTALPLQLLPPIAYAGSDDRPPPGPDEFRGATSQEGSNRPAGGLWCAPVTSRAADGSAAATAWTDWLATPDPDTRTPSHHLGRYTRLTEVEPLPHARVYLVDTAQHLDDLVEAYRLPAGHPMRRTTPDWAAAAGAGWDAVYVSAAGLDANAERHLMAEPSLARWDCATVLWLNAAYRIPAG